MTKPTPKSARVPDPSAELANSAVRRGQATLLDPHLSFFAAKARSAVRTTTIGHAVLAPPHAPKAAPTTLGAGERPRNAREMDSVAALPAETQPVALHRPESACGATLEMSAEERRRAMAEMSTLELLPALPRTGARDTPKQPDLPTRSMSMEEMLSAPAEPPFLGQPAIAQPPSAAAPETASATQPPEAPVAMALAEPLGAAGFRSRGRGSRALFLATVTVLALGVTGGSLYLKRHPALLRPYAGPAIALVQRGVELARATLTPAKSGPAPRRAAPGRPPPAKPRVTQLTPRDEVRTEPAAKPAQAIPKGAASASAHRTEPIETVNREALPARAAQRPAAREHAAADPTPGPAKEDSGALFASPHTAAELYIAGRYKEALAEYRTLATLNPDVHAYTQFARILRRRLVEICVRTQPHRQTECEQL